MQRYAPHLLLVAALLCNAAANILIKYAMSRGPKTGFGAYLQPVYLLALVLFGLNLLAYSSALRSLKISVAYPVMVSTGFLIILAAGWILFQERLQGTQYVGVFLVMAGIWLVVR